MRCPACGSFDDKVVDSRQSDDGTSIRRRRSCLACQGRFTTFERLEEVTLLVRKRSGVREPFDRAKVVAGLAAAHEEIGLVAGDVPGPGRERLDGGLLEPEARRVRRDPVDALLRRRRPQAQATGRGDDEGVGGCTGDEPEAAVVSVETGDVAIGDREVALTPARAAVRRQLPVAGRRPDRRRRVVEGDPQVVLLQTDRVVAERLIVDAVEAGADAALDDLVVGDDLVLGTRDRRRRRP